MSSIDIFHVLVAAHIVTGASGLAIFWVPVVSRKGAALHRYWGRIFTWLMLATGTIAIGMSSMTIMSPVATHPQLVDHAVFGDENMVRGIFGWMMLYLAVLTVNLAWYGWMCIRNRRNHAGNRGWFNMSLQGILTVAAVNCAWQGWVIQQPMMIGISVVGFATVGTNLRFMLKVRPGPVDWLMEHIKALVGAGISVYTAFFAFGAVRIMPELALTPALWAVPLVTGLTLIIYHQRVVSRKARRPSGVAGAAS
jgi:hypothetical protein